MKILYLKLKNYATIYTAMGLKEIEIDFSKSQNNIILFVGDNGSGKTSILSTLHPFPYYGSMDIRNNNSILREDKDGYKEIHIQDGDTIYKIQHHYKNTKRGIILNSFIQKNDEELNPNGNVTSFNDIVKNELSLELDFLRVLRLGSNVTNLIDMKAAERKSFTSYLLSDINVYTDLLKKITEDNRVLRSTIKTVSDKLTRLNVLDKSVLVSNINDYNNKISKLNNDRNNLQQRLGSVEGKILDLLPEGLDSTLEKLNNLKYSLSTLSNEENKINKSINKLCIILTRDINDELDIVTKLLSDKENQYKLNENMILFYKEQLSPLYNKKDELTNQLKLSVSDITYRQMHNLYIELSDKITEYEKKYKDYEPIYTKDNLLSLLDLLKQIDNVANETYGFGMNAIRQTVDLIKGYVNVDNHINKKLQEIDKDILKITTEFKSSLNTSSPVILFKPENCPEENCPYLYLYDVLFNTNKSDNKSLASLESEKETLKSISYVNKNIKYIFMLLTSSKSLISKGDIPYFKIDNILNSMIKGASLFDEDYMTDLIAEAEDYEEYLELKSKAKEIKAELNMLQYDSSNITKMRNDLLDIDKSINDISTKSFYIESDNNSIKHDIESITEYIDKLNQYSSYIDNLKELSNNKNDISTQIVELTQAIENASGLTNESKIINQNISMIDWEIKKLNDELFNMKVTLKEFESLSQEQDILNQKFDDINIIKESLSSTKGIPLLYMQLYLKNVKMFVNELLKVVYKDNFEIDDFDINESEFSIPYIKNNIRISDVSYASQGEKSFLSLALSFALINQSIKDYNILLLDEIDSTLDIRNRAMFLNILEKQMESISAEQVFLITHNNMFENYPVDIILTSHNKVNQYTNANIIFSI